MRGMCYSSDRNYVWVHEGWTEMEVDSPRVQKGLLPQMVATLSLVATLKHSQCQ